MDHFTLACYNCKGAIRNSLYMCELLKDYNADVLSISEHWLFPHTKSFLDCLDANYCSYSNTDARSETSTLKRGLGGVGIIWKKSITHLVQVLPVTDGRMCGIRIKTGPSNFLVVISVYLPSAESHSQDFTTCLQSLEELYIEHSV